MKKLCVLFFAIATLSGCSSLGEAIQLGIQDAGVTFGASASVATGVDVRNSRGQEIILVPRKKIEMTIP